MRLTVNVYRTVETQMKFKMRIVRTVESNRRSPAIARQVHRCSLLRLARKAWQAGTVTTGARKWERHDDDTSSALRRGPTRSQEEGHMCPACIASTALMVSGAGTTGGILALCIGKFRKFFRANCLGLFQKAKET